jgi:hypothetical protein
MKFINIKINHIILVLMLLNFPSNILSSRMRSNSPYTKHGDGKIKRLIKLKIIKNLKI